MTDAARDAALELEEDLSFEQSEWRRARLLWFILLAVMGATGLGLFGNGFLSQTRAGDLAGPLWVEYSRVARFGSPVRLEVHARSQPDGSVQFTVGGSLLQALQIEQVTPPPSSARIVEEGVEYRFEAGTSGTGRVIFEMQPAARWNVDGEIRSPDATVRLRQFVLP
jgi:hypothetical protein